MGTSSTKPGKNSRNISNITGETAPVEVSWQSVKSAATKFFKGSLEFSIVMQKMIKASGGPSKFALGTRTRISNGYAKLFGVISSASSVGIRQALIDLGRKDNPEKSAKELLIDYVNEEICPESTTAEDTIVREELLTAVIRFSELFDESGFVDLKLDVTIHAVKALFKEMLVDSIEKAFEQEVPFSIETEDPKDYTVSKNEAKRMIENKVEEYMANYSDKDFMDKDKIEGIENEIYNSVLNDFDNGDFDNHE